MNGCLRRYEQCLDSLNPVILTGVSNLENIMLGLYNMKIQEMDTVFVGEKNEENKLHSCPESFHPL